MISLFIFHQITEAQHVSCLLRFLQAFPPVDVGACLSALAHSLSVSACTRPGLTPCPSQSAIPIPRLHLSFLLSGLTPLGVALCTFPSQGKQAAK